MMFLFRYFICTLRSFAVKMENRNNLLKKIFSKRKYHFIHNTSDIHKSLGSIDDNYRQTHYTVANYTSFKTLLGDSDFTSLNKILHEVKNGNMSLQNAEQVLVENIEAIKYFSTSHDSTMKTLHRFVDSDHARAKRTGFPEVIFGKGKTGEQISLIFDDMAGHINEFLRKETNTEEHVSTTILATRVDEALFKQIESRPPHNGTITYYPIAGIVSMNTFLQNRQTKIFKSLGKVIIACAGTTDIPVAEEAAITLQSASCQIERVYDVGVAGLHRILKKIPLLQADDVKCIIVCAGMDGALPSVIAGLVTVPVFAVPTSVGYGTSFDGVSAMLTMLNSCAPGVGVLNIDNGFGAAALAFKCINTSNIP